MTDPLEEFLGHEKQAALTRAQKDFRAWQQWKETQQSDDLASLLRQVDPLIRKASNVYAGKVNIPRSAIRAEFQIQAIKAFNTYDPKRGTQLNTYLTDQLKRGRRFVTTYQNIGTIPENRIHKITTFNNARQRLEDQLGREPSAHELADRLKWPVREVSALTVELSRKPVATSALAADMSSFKPSEEAERLRLLQFELDPEEKLVYEYLLGVNGKPQLRPGQIATKLRMSPSKVSRLKNNIAVKAKQYA